MSTATPRPVPEPVLVCGLGRLGQSCVASLLDFRVPVRGLDLSEAPAIADLGGALESLSFGDCRVPETLRRAGVEACRAVVLVAGGERVNIAAALAVRALNPRARIVVRSSQRNLNRFLSGHLGNFVALDPTLLSAPALALAALGDETLGLFHLEGELVRVIRHVLTPGHPWVGGLPHDVGGAHRRVLSLRTRGAAQRFDDWTAEEPLRPGDVLTCVELADARSTPAALEPSPTPGDRVEVGRRPARVSLRETVATRWQGAPQIVRVAIVSAGAIASLYLGCALLYRLQYPEIGNQDALNLAMVLILGGFDNVFGQLKLPFPIPLWLHAFSVLVSISGTVGIGILYALLTERVLSVRFQFFLRKPRLPRRDHVLLVGAGPLAAEVAALLTRWKRPVVALGPSDAWAALAPVPVVAGPLEESLTKASVGLARSLVALGDDDVANLESALTARAASQKLMLVVRADDRHFRDNVGRLVAGARVLGLQALAADAFAAAAFGENIHQLLHVEDRTLLVTEYDIETIDTLCGKLVGEIADGFGVLPIFLHRAGGRSDFFPSDDVRLREGDRLVVLAAVDALQRIESGASVRPSFEIAVDVAPSPAAAFDVALTIARVSGCDISAAQTHVASLPGILAVRLHARQAGRLVRELGKMHVTARIRAASPSPE